MIKDSTELPLHDKMPEKIIPAGLSRDRQVYLYEKIREFVPEKHRDDVCPKPSDYEDNVSPSAPAPTCASTSAPVPTCASTSAPVPMCTSGDTDEPVEEPARKKRKCSRCKQTGHNIRNCPQNKL